MHFVSLSHLGNSRNILGFFLNQCIRFDDLRSVVTTRRRLGGLLTFLSDAFPLGVDIVCLDMLIAR